MPCWVLKSKVVYYIRAVSAKYCKIYSTACLFKKVLFVKVSKCLIKLCIFIYYSSYTLSFRSPLYIYKGINGSWVLTIAASIKGIASSVKTGSSVLVLFKCTRVGTSILEVVSKQTASSVRFPN